MIITKRSIITLILALTLSVTGIVSLSGCSRNNNSNTVSSSSNTITSNTPVFSDVDDQILTSAYADYNSLKKNSSPQAAREQVLKELQTQNNVETAEMGVDGTTIFITYKDGDEAAVDTYDPKEKIPVTTSYLPNGGLSEASYASLCNFDLGANYTGRINEGFPIINNVVTASDATVSLTETQQNETWDLPKSKKVLILSPLGPADFPEEEYTEDKLIAPLACKKYFEAHGWTDNDITLKINTDESPGCFNVKPEDYFNLNKYGVILFFGHGSAWKNFNDDNIYLQFSNVSRKALYANNQYWLWKTHKQIIIVNPHTSEDGTKWYNIFIRGDLLKEELGQLPESYVQLATCWGAYFHDVFIKNGAAMFMGWDNKILSDQADPNQVNMVTLMLDGNLSALDAYHDKPIEKEIYKYIHFYYYTPLGKNYSYYMPAWINLKITGIPSGTAYLDKGLDLLSNNNLSGVAFPIGSTNISGQSQIEINNLDNRYFPPGNYAIRINALAQNQKTTDASFQNNSFQLHAGENDLVVDLSTGVMSNNTPAMVITTSTTTQ